MKSRKPLYHRHRFPEDVIRHTVWLYYRFYLSYRDVEDLLAERGIAVSYETIRRWCLRFGPIYAHRLRKRSGSGGDQWFVDNAAFQIDRSCSTFLIGSWRDAKPVRHPTSSDASATLPDLSNQGFYSISAGDVRLKAAQPTIS